MSVDNIFALTGADLKQQFERTDEQQTRRNISERKSNDTGPA